MRLHLTAYPHTRSQLHILSMTDAVVTTAPTAAPPSYFLADEADAEWLLIGAILVFFMRES